MRENGENFSRAKKDGGGSESRKAPLGMSVVDVVVVVVVVVGIVDMRVEANKKITRFVFS